MTMAPSEIRTALAHFIAALPYPIASRNLIYEEALRCGFTARELREHGAQALCRAAEMRVASGRIRA